MRTQIRKLARQLLPDSLRHPLGAAAGKVDEHVFKRLGGFLFDLRGGLYRADGCEFIIAKDLTTMPYRSEFLSDLYEGEERQMVREFVQPSDAVLELGACIGVVSCVTNQILADKKRHVVIEANPFCIPSLYRNRNLNRAEFLIENCVVTAQPEVVFHVSPCIRSGAMLAREKSIPVRVPVRSLGDLEKRYGPFTTLIMDIEGGELEVLEAARENLRGYRLVILELHDFAIGQKGIERCRAILTEAGLKLCRQQSSVETWRRLSSVANFANVAPPANAPPCAPATRARRWKFSAPTGRKAFPIRQNSISAPSNFSTAACRRNSARTGIISPRTAAASARTPFTRNGFCCSANSARNIFWRSACFAGRA
jgi:FkbM family methyltransferase